MFNADSRRIPVRRSASLGDGYEVRVDSGSWDHLPALLAEHCPAHAYALITDDRVAELHAGRLADRLRASGLTVELLVFPMGEGSKTRDMWSALTDAMFAAGLGRDAAVLAVGGGVVGDLAGFVAATYMRGLPLVQLPTTVLAMIDSSVGGKTGVDTPAGKNLVGAFHRPRIVIADSATLRTLPRAHLAAGTAEAIKHGAIADAEYLAWIESRIGDILDADAAALDELVVRSVEIKAAVVGRDEHERGPRKALNFGHTIGHAVEALSDFRILHGEAVAIGMVAEARLGERLGITAIGTAARLRSAIAAAELPTTIPAGFAPEDILSRTRLDKKSRAGRVQYALIERAGAASAGADDAWSTPVDADVVLEVLQDG